MRKFLALAAAVIGAVHSTARAAEPAPLPDVFVARLEALALIQTLNARVLASRSATLALESWCGEHHMASEPKIVARRVAEVEKPASAETRVRLRVGPEEPIKYRRVQLVCGDHVLAEADNWYVPARLPAEANKMLETTQTPFGKAVQSLQPFRRTFETKILWSPLPEGWEMQRQATGAVASAPLSVPHDIFEHRVVLFSAEQTPFSEVDETYTKEILDFDLKAAPLR